MGRGELTAPPEINIMSWAHTGNFGEKAADETRSEGIDHLAGHRPKLEE